MIIRITTISVLMLLCSTKMSAQHITEAAAMAKAQQFMQGKTMSIPGAGKGMRRVAATTDNNAFYIFNAEGGGYVIVSADERTNDILGYSTTGTIDPNNMPDNMRAWLQGYEEQINALDADTAVGTGVKAAPAKVPVHAAVAPMVTARWDQLAPYFLECPTATPSGGGTAQHCPTGCVATALAQIMHYHQWPQKSTTAIPAYDYDPIIKIFGRIVYNKHLQKLPATTFNWDILRNEYNESDADASAMEVAKLMRYCGQSVKMDYALDGSGALNDASVLTDYFGYDSRATNVSRANYGIDEWDALIYHEIEQGRPVWYSGFQPSGGHSFVCDGYDGDGGYHFNWGWGGSYDGYYRLSIIAPDGTGTGGGIPGRGFTINQGAVIGIQPPGADSEELGKKVVAQITLATANNGGSAVPLWNTWLDGMQEGAPEADEIDVAGIKAMFAEAFEELDDMSGAKVGDKTMMDAVIPASEAIAAYDGASESELFSLAAEAALQGAENTKNFTSKFGRAKTYGAKTIGTPDAGATSMAKFFEGLAKA